ncbi:MAG: hypothetical protein EOO27_18000 [Comamonadaceae bacterium]|nr:MAG: hypothetical protein EOO27_18000 [Comamonadaceae bacterium]
MEIEADLPGKHVDAATTPPDICASAIREMLQAQGIASHESECAGIAKFLRRIAPPLPSRAPQ